MAKSFDVTTMNQILDLLVKQKAGIENLIDLVKSKMAKNVVEDPEPPPKIAEAPFEVDCRRKRNRKRKQNLPAPVPFDSTHKYLKVIIRGLPPLDTYELERNLKLLGYPVISTYYMHLGPEKKLSRFVLAYLLDDENGQEIFEMRQLSHFPVVVERPYTKSPAKNDRCYSRNALDGRIEIIDKEGFQTFLNFDRAPEWEHMKEYYFTRF